MEEHRCENCNYLMSTLDYNLYPVKLTPEKQPLDSPRNKPDQSSDNFEDQKPIPEPPIIYCYKCVLEQNLKCEAIQISLYEEIERNSIKATCNCTKYTPKDSQPLAGYLFEPSSLEVYCERCQVNDCIDLRTKSIRQCLEDSFELLKQNPDSPLDIIQECSNNSLFSVSEFCEKLRKLRIYLAEEYYCTEHLRMTAGFSLEKFSFVCDLCEARDAFNINDPENLETVKKIAVEYCAGVETGRFTISMIKYFNHPNPGLKEIRNLIYDITKIKKMNIKTPVRINARSFCLSCAQQFDLDGLLPVSLHGLEKHEICLKCFESNGNICPIDGGFFEVRKFSDFISEDLCDFEQECCTCSETLFKVFNSKPYVTSCLHYICSSCFTGKEKSKKCSFCDIYIYVKDSKLDLFLTRKIRHFEVTCPVDSKPSCLIQKTSEKICDKCLSFKRSEISCLEPIDKEEICREHNELCSYLLKKFQIRCYLCYKKSELASFKEYKDVLKKIIKEKFNYSDSFIDFIKEKIEFLPIGFLSKLVRMRGSESRTLTRFERLPSTSGIPSVWNENGSSVTFTLISNVRFTLQGIYIGKIREGLTNVQLQKKDNRIHFWPCETRFEKTILLVFEPISISKAVNFTITLEPGEYFQGFVSRYSDLRQRMRIDEKYYIDIQMKDDTTESGYNDYNGPILGLSIGGIYIDKSMLNNLT